MSNIDSKELKIGNNFFISDTAKISAQEVIIGDNVSIGDNVIITCNKLVIDSNSIIEKDTSINFNKIEIGFKSKIEKNCKIQSISGQGDLFHIGDFSFIAFNQSILVPKFYIGDYTSIHNSCLINGYKECVLGSNCWVGQNTILNSTEKLIIGNNVRIGTQSKIWTHVASGELLEGCLMFGEFPVIIEDNVWIVGGATVSPNLTLKNGSIIMTDSVITKSTEVRHCYAGVPAKDITDKIKTYKDVTLDDKFEMMKGFVNEFNLNNNNLYLNEVIISDLPFDEFIIDLESKIDKNKDYIVVLKHVKIKKISANISFFSLEEKKYTKLKTPLEEKFIRFNVGHRARFLPLED